MIPASQQLDGPTEVVFRDLVFKLESHRRRLAHYDMYLEGEQSITFLAPALREEFGERITALVLNFSRLITGAYEDRLDVEGFRYARKSSADDALWEVWQANDLDEQSQQGHYDSIGLGRSYVLVGSGDTENDAPVVTVESPLQVFAHRDPRTRRVDRAVKRWDENADMPGQVAQQHAMLYLPNVSRHLVSTDDGWRIVWEDQHDLGVVPVVPLVNRPRLLRPDGLSEFHDAIGPADAMNKLATDMMVSAEYHSMPRRWAAGVKESDFVDEHGSPLSPWSRDAGTLWAVESTEAKFGQFNESDLANFHNSIKFLVQIVVQLAGLPPHYASFSSGDSNPTSADAIRSAETQLVKRSERKQTYLGGAWESVMRLVQRIQTGEWDPAARSLETIWRDASTPTMAQKADAILKLATPVQNGLAVLPIEQAREDLGYTPEQRRRMAELDKQAQQDPYLATLSAKDGAANASTAPAPASGD